MAFFYPECFSLQNVFFLQNQSSGVGHIPVFHYTSKHNINYLSKGRFPAFGHTITQNHADDWTDSCGQFEEIMRTILENRAVLWAKTMGRMSPNILMNELIHSIVFQNLLNSFSKSS
jgi:hypothetical protein